MQSDEPGARSTLSRRTGLLAIDRVAGSVLLVFSLFVLWECRNIPFGSLAEPGPGAVPALLALTLLACSIILIAAGNPADHLSAVAWPEWRHGVAILGACAFMALALERLGYRLTIFVALLALVGLVEKKGWMTAAVFAGIFAFGTYYLFDTLLKVPLPQGPFGV